MATNETPAGQLLGEEQRDPNASGLTHLHKVSGQKKPGWLQFDWHQVFIAVLVGVMDW